MATYPDGIPELREVENDPGVAYDPLQKNVVFAEDVNNIASEIIAIATELGTNPKDTFANVAARLADIGGKVATYGGSIASLTNRVTALENKKYTRVIGYVRRGAGELSTGSIANNAIAFVRNDANTSDLLCSIPSSNQKLLLTITITVWCSQSGWWNISYVRMTGSGQIVPGQLEGLSYLQNGVNTFTFQYVQLADTTTTGFKIRLQNVSGNAGVLNYKQAMMLVEEVNL